MQRSACIPHPSPQNNLDSGTGNIGLFGALVRIGFWCGFVSAPVRSRFHLHGSMYSGSVMHFLKTLAIFTIIWEITMVVVARVMLFMYRRVQCLSLAHLPHLRLHFRQMTTPHHRIVAGLSYEEARLHSHKYPHERERGGANLDLIRRTRGPGQRASGLAPGSSQGSLEDHRAGPARICA